MQKSWMGDIPNTHVRDYQRKKVYDAEDSCMFWGDTQVLTYAAASYTDLTLPTIYSM